MFRQSLQVSRSSFMGNLARSALVFIAGSTIAGSSFGADDTNIKVDALSRSRLLVAQAGAAKSAGASVQAELDALIKAAKAEGTLTFYLSPPENVAKRIADTFSTKYGIKAQYVRLTGVALQTRFSAEAESGNVAADLAILNGSHVNAYAEDGIKKGWMDSVSDASLPVIKGGEFPSKFNKGASAVVQVAPWLIVYNVDRAKGADVPKDWPDLLNPKWKGQYILPDPRSSGVYIELWSAIIEKYGESFLTQLYAQAPRPASSGVPAAQALAAGEGAISAPNIMSVVESVKSKGGPISTVVPDYTTGVEQSLILTARSRARNPNAARLFANYLMSREGNAVFNDDPGGMTIYDTTRLPKDYQAPKVDSAKRKDQIVKLLGL